MTRCHLAGQRGCSENMTTIDLATLPVRTRPVDVAAASLEHAGLLARAVSFRGPSHELYDEPRQDSFAVAASPDHLVVAVSDGIGSCPYSHLGSAAAAQAMADVLGDDAVALDEVEALLGAASSAVRGAAMAAGVDDASVRSTLTVAVIEADARAGPGCTASATHRPSYWIPRRGPGRSSPRPTTGPRTGCTTGCRTGSTTTSPPAS